MAIHLKWVRLEGFRSFRERSEVHLPEKGMVLVRGRNQLTHGSSGSGKSNFNLGLAYSLGYCGIPATRLKSWSIDQGGWGAAVALEGPKGTLEAHRGSSSLVKLNGQHVRGGAEAREKAIQEFFGGVPIDMIGSQTFRPQRTPGLFLSKDDGEKKEFLSTLLGLSQFEVAAEVADAAAAKVLVQIAPLQGALEMLRQTIDALAKEPDTKLPEVEHLLKREQELQAAYDRAEENLTESRTELREFDEETTVGRRIIMRAHCSSVLKDAQAAVASRAAPQFKHDATKLNAAHGRLKATNERVERLERIAAQKRREHNQKMSELHREVGDLQALVNRSDEVQKLFDEQDAIITTLDALQCPTCERPWKGSDNRRVWSDAIDKRDGYGTTLRRINEANERIPELKQNLAEMSLATFEEANFQQLLSLRTQIQQECANETAAMTNATRSHEALVAQFEAESQRLLNDAKGRALEIESEFQKKTTTERAPLAASVQNAETKLKEVLAPLQQARVDVARAEEQAKAWRAHELARTTRLGDRQKELEAKEAELAQLITSERAERDFSKLIGREGFLGAIFDEVLAEISNETNDILGHVPNVAHLTLQFRSEVASQKGTAKRRIKPVIFIGAEERDVKDLSGGMTTVVELATDLAVGAVVARRTGISPGWLVLDEPFEGLGQVEKEACMEMLQHAGEHRLILVVDHGAEIKEAFTKFIDIEFADGESRIVETT